MTMIKCSECGKEISDQASMCIGCDAPILSGPAAVTARTPPPAFENLGDMNGDGRVDFEDFKAAYNKIKESSPEALDTEDSETTDETSPKTP